MPEPIPQRLDEVLKRIIGSRGGTRILVVGTLSGITSAHGHWHVVDPGAILETPPGAVERFDLALLAGALEHLPRDRASRLLAALRDLWARRILAAVPAAPGSGTTAAPRTLERTVEWTLEDMLSHGFEARGTATGPEGALLALYEFDIDHYKRTPDWLNPRHWANPQLWNRHRW